MSPPKVFRGSFVVAEQRTRMPPDPPEVATLYQIRDRSRYQSRRREGRKGGREEKRLSHYQCRSKVMILQDCLLIDRPGIIAGPCRSALVGRLVVGPIPDLHGNLSPLAFSIAF
jgi:hypothetical protein